MQHGELRRWHTALRAVGPGLVVIASPVCNQCPRVGQGVKVMVVQALVRELPVEALDVGILCRLVGGDQLQLNAPSVSPVVHCSARELGTLIDSDRPGKSAELSASLQNVRHVLPGDAVVDRNVQALAREVIACPTVKRPIAVLRRSKWRFSAMACLKW